MQRVIPVWITSFVLAALLCAQERTNAPPAAADWQAPPKVAARRNPLAGSPSAAKRGQKLYVENCAACHGENGTPSLDTATSFQQPLPEKDGALFWKIATGNPRRGMPSFKRLTSEQRWELVSYIRTLSQTKSARENR